MDLGPLLSCKFFWVLIKHLLKKKKNWRREFGQAFFTSIQERLELIICNLQELQIYHLKYIQECVVEDQKRFFILIYKIIIIFKWFGITQLLNLVLAASNAKERR